MLLQMLAALLLKALNLKLIDPVHDQNFPESIYLGWKYKRKRGKVFAFPRFFIAYGSACLLFD
jgi:hypothetical protein